MNEYFLKLQAISELREIARTAKANKEAAEIVLSTLEWLNRYCDKNHIVPPNEGLIIEQMTKLQAVLGESPTKLKQPNKTTEDATEYPFTAKSFYPLHPGSLRNS